MEEASLIQFHADVAMDTIHWYNQQTQCWLSRSGGVHWEGWKASPQSGLPQVQDVTSWTPWDRTFNNDKHPYVRWYQGGLTNAAYNEVDRHVLAGFGHEIAAIQFCEDGTQRKVRRDELLLESATRACYLQELGLAKGDRVLFHMSNSLEQLYWIEACKRCAIVISCTAIDQPTAVLGARIEDLGATTVLTHSSQGAAEKITALAPHSVRVVDAEALSAELQIHREKLKSDSGVDWNQIAAVSPAVPVEANFPLLVSYTSGTTGKPKGIVHVHGGYVSGVAHTMKTVFGAVPGRDTIFVVANPGWITGQSYMISAALTTRTTTVIMEGSAIVPSVLRFASIIRQSNATIFKAGSTFIRAIMTSEATVKELDSFQLPDQLRVATFCAEPVNGVVHEFAAKHICRRYLNSYWGTEHGGVVWSILVDDERGSETDAHTKCLPWIKGGVCDVSTGQIIAPEQQGDVVISDCYPYLARTVWGDLDQWCADPDQWQGNIGRWCDYFDDVGNFIQGDSAVQHTDGTYTFHGRSDDVMNIGGNRYGNAQIENAILGALPGLMKNVVVVGVDDDQNGLSVVAVVVAKEVTMAH